MINKSKNISGKQSNYKRFYVADISILKMSQKKKNLKVGFLSFILSYHKRYYIYLYINKIISKLRIILTVNTDKL